MSKCYSQSFQQWYWYKCSMSFHCVKHFSRNYYTYSKTIDIVFIFSDCENFYLKIVKNLLDFANGLLMLFNLTDNIRKWFCGPAKLPSLDEVYQIRSRSMYDHYHLTNRTHFSVQPTYSPLFVTFPARITPYSFGRFGVCKTLSISGN